MNLPEAARHRVIVRCGGKQRDHAGEDDGDARARPLDLWPETRDGKARGNRRPLLHQQRWQHRTRQRADMEQRHRTPDDIVGIDRRGHAALDGLVADIIVADHAALGRTGRAGRIQDAGQVAGDRLDRIGQNGPVARAIQWCDLGSPNGFCGRRPAHQDMPHIGQAVRDFLQPLQIAVLAHHQRASGVAELRCQKILAQRRVHRRPDRAELVDGEPHAQTVDIIVEHRGDGVARLHAEFAKGGGQLAAGPVEIAEAVAVAFEIEE